MAGLHVNMCAARLSVEIVHGGRLLGSRSGSLIKLGVTLPLNSHRPLSGNSCATTISRLLTTQTHTCISRLGLYPEFSPLSRTYNIGHLCRLNLSYRDVPNQNRRFYSIPPKSNRHVSITEDILKSKDASVPIAGEGGPTSPREGDAQKKDRSKEDKKKNWWFRTENAWKVGLISLSGLGVLLCANALMLWGTLI